MHLSQTDAATASGPGWSALVTPRFLYLYVDPAGDYLPDAIAAVLSPVRQAFYTVEYSHEDESGWDVYYVRLTMEDCYIEAHRVPA